MSKDLQKEIQKIRIDAEKDADKQLKKLLRAYKTSMNNIQKEIGQIYAKYSKDGILSVSNKQRLAILQSLNNELRQMYYNLGNLDEQLTLDSLLNTYQNTYYKTIYTIDKGVKTNINFALLNPKIIEKAVNVRYKGELFSDRIWNNKKLLISRVKSNINRAAIEGKAIDKLYKDISITFGSSAYESKRLLNTELARVVSEAQANIYANTDVVKKVMYDATLDNKTSDICAALDGNIYNANENYPKSPQHPNCRSVIIPIVDGWQPTIKLDNESKQNINYKTYEDWKSSKGIN